MKAPEILQKAAEIMEERGRQYDKPEGERSMGRAVLAFNAITGRDLTESEGWLLLQVLKDVRQWQNPDKPHQDSLEDCVAYAALKAECMLESQEKESIPNQFEKVIIHKSNIDDGGWIEWSGGDCPVHEESSVECIFFNGDTSIIRQAGSFEWDNIDHPGDIIKYRVVKDPAHT